MKSGVSFTHTFHPQRFFCITNEFCLYMFSYLCPYIKYSLESKPAMGIWVKELCSWEARLSLSFLLFLLEHYLTCACWFPPVSKKQVNRCTRISAQSLAHSTWLVRAITVFAFPFHVICLGNQGKQMKVFFLVSYTNTAYHSALESSTNISWCPLTPFSLARLQGSSFRSCRLRAECHKAAPFNASCKFQVAAYAVTD